MNLDYLVLQLVLNNLPSEERDDPYTSFALLHWERKLLTKDYSTNA
ncbi:MAG: hypothetical protein J6R25_00510 [Bacteroidales bacterium]|nr:hypothetical protein [Bacteroidales bacterium]